MAALAQKVTGRPEHLTTLTYIYVNIYLICTLKKWNTETFFQNMETWENEKKKGEKGTKMKPRKTSETAREGRKPTEKARNTWKHSIGKRRSQQLV